MILAGCFWLVTDSAAAAAEVEEKIPAGCVPTVSVAACAAEAGQGHATEPTLPEPGVGDGLTPSKKSRSKAKAAKKPRADIDTDTRFISKEEMKVVSAMPGDPDAVICLLCNPRKTYALTSWDRHLETKHKSGLLGVSNYKE